jgi:hypothetical protein
MFSGRKSPISKAASVSQKRDARPRESSHQQERTIGEPAPTSDIDRRPKDGRSTEKGEHASICDQLERHHNSCVVAILLRLVGLQLIGRWPASTATASGHLQTALLNARRAPRPTSRFRENAPPKEH